MEITTDLRKINAIDAELYDRVLSLYALQKLKPIERSLKLKKYADDDESVKGLVRFLNFITENVVEARDYEKAIERLDATLADLASGDTEVISGWNRVKGSLENLSDYFVEKKVEDLKDRYSRIVSFQITSDVRPVFNIKRSEIHQLIYPHILKIETSDDKLFLCEFYDDVLDELISELEMVRTKSRLIRDTYVRRGS